MGIRIEKVSRASLILVTMLLMLAGLFTSRILLSVSMEVFILLTCVHKSFVQQFKAFCRNPFLLGMSCLFLIPLISGVHEQNMAQWAVILRIKLPLLLLPLAFAGSWQLSKSQWHLLSLVFLFFAFAACCYSLWQYAAHMQDLNKSYLQAKVIPTSLENDHVRFSWLISFAAMLALYIIRNEQKTLVRILMALLAVFFTVYLHILSARTGLVSLYIFLLLLVAEMLMKKRNRKWAFAICVLVMIMPLGAWFSMPTFRNRVHYFNYDYSFVQQNAYLPGSNDGTRINSFRAGWNIMKQHPFGIGAGDVMNKASKWYDVHIPGILPSDKILPGNEWLVYGDAAGWIGFIAFTIIMILPFTQRAEKDKVFWIALCTSSALSLLFDIGLEVQFGVFCYAFFLLWWWKKVCGL
jgi:hypothetical protein